MVRTSADEDDEGVSYCKSLFHVTTCEKVSNNCLDVHNTLRPTRMTRKKVADAMGILFVVTHTGTQS